MLALTTRSRLNARADIAAELDCVVHDVAHRADVRFDVQIVEVRTFAACSTRICA